MKIFIFFRHHAYKWISPLNLAYFRHQILSTKYFWIYNFSQRVLLCHGKSDFCCFKCMIYCNYTVLLADKFFYIDICCLIIKFKQSTCDNDTPRVIFLSSICQSALSNITFMIFTRDSIYAIARICYRPSVRKSQVSSSPESHLRTTGSHRSGVTILLAAWHQRAHPALTLASKAGTRFTYPEGWKADLTVGDVPAELVGGWSSSFAFC